MRWGSGVTVFLLLLVAAAVAIGLVSHLPHRDVALPPPPLETAVPLPPPPIGSQWRYTTPQAATASDLGEEACTRSAADVEIGAGARSTARLCLRRGGGYPYA